ncbi:SDR family NAD(P)-dependent oxidoreductase [Actibacterium pelagium]|uniref:Short-chain dehydrogenase n=1 Tax=Actibacterium pelagium TaxID=2029103 RepID=A0A917ABD2_9RHOB|nr:SDR family NAD(P)-dependent oxidoreductase [Actibacterium pelagium]GGE38734.1 short-chain dehydrogenase [Actibacterium pelagium]
MFAGKTFWLVGASEGLGRALAVALSKDGARVILSARSADKLKALVDELPDAVALPFDVTDPADVSHAYAECPPLDGVIYCAGSYDPMTAQEWKSEPVRQMIATNFSGGAEVVGQALPDFVERDIGHIVLIGSLAGYRGLPGAIGYGASKAALMHLGETLYADLRKTGVKVQVINPGFIKTRLTEKNSFDMPQIMTPEEAADHVIRAMRSGRFSTAFPRPFAWVFTLGRFLPRKLFYRLMG